MRHRAWVEIDLGQIAHNTAQMVELVRPAQLIAVVKSNAYGHGLDRVWRPMLDGGAASFAVSEVVEGVALRAAGVASPIMTLTEPAEYDIAAAVGASIDLTVYSFTTAQLVATAAQEASVVAEVHVKLDTGTRRAGCEPSDASALVAMIGGEPHLRLGSFWSQFADAADDRRTEGASRALSLFQVTATSSCVEGTTAHIANTAASISMPDARLDAVRSGIALYGYSSQASQDVVASLGLAPAIKLLARVRGVKEVAEGDTVGYGTRVVATRPMVIGNVGVGYAHGVSRDWGSRGGWVGLGGKRCAIVGAVSMEQMLVDLTDVRSDVRLEGSTVTVVGDGHDGPSASDMATATRTIANEVLCRIGLSRLPRTYVADYG